MIPVFSFRSECTPGDHNTIVAIPAGSEPGSCFTGFHTTSIAIQTRNNSVKHETVVQNWRDVIFFEAVRKCSNEVQGSLLQYRYGREIAKGVAGTAGGIMLGVATGPIGVGVGAVARAVLGGSTDGIASGASITEQIVKSDQ